MIDKAEDAPSLLVLLGHILARRNFRPLASPLSLPKPKPIACLPLVNPHPRVIYIDGMPFLPANPSAGSANAHCPTAWESFPSTPLPSEGIVADGALPEGTTWVIPNDAIELGATPCSPWAATPIKVETEPEDSLEKAKAFAQRVFRAWLEDYLYDYARAKERASELRRAAEKAKGAFTVHVIVNARNGEMTFGDAAALRVVGGGDEETIIPLTVVPGSGEFCVSPDGKGAVFKLISKAQSDAEDARARSAIENAFNRNAKATVLLQSTSGDVSESGEAPFVASKLSPGAALMDRAGVRRGPSPSWLRSMGDWLRGEK